MKKIALLITLFAMIGIANAGTLLRDTDADPQLLNGTIVLSKTGWTINGVAQSFSGLPYELVGDIYVQTGSITIEAGVVTVGFQPNISGLIICRDSDVFINGTVSEPVIMTSAEDVATWVGSVVTRGGAAIPDGSGTPGITVPAVTAITTMGDPRTGTARIACNEWGNLVILGKGYISSTVNQPTNVKYPAATNVDAMEGLRVGNPVGVTTGMVSYGGGDDDDNSGSIQYLSLRYGGRSDVPLKELNGLSLGGVGRGTDISYIEIFSNLDDGFEIWGGTVELDHVVVWNIGDDNFDLDQGWRGKASYGLIVQGLCKAGAASADGSGGGDNAFETDGAEDSDAQPVTTAVISNFTTIGDPVAADDGTAWRCNARVQYDNCIWMDLGEQLVQKDGATDGSQDYGFNGTLSWADTWTTTYDAAWNKAHARAAFTSNHPHVAAFSQAQLQAIYPTQTAGNLAQITNSVFFNNLNATAYTEAIARGVLAATTVDLSPNGTMGNIIKGARPIQYLLRRPPIAPSNYQLVSYINPLPVSGVTAGGFSSYNWLSCWTAVYAYGLTSSNDGRLGSADLDCDGGVGMSDLSSFSSQWLQ